VSGYGFGEISDEVLVGRYLSSLQTSGGPAVKEVEVNHRGTGIRVDVNIVPGRELRDFFRGFVQNRLWPIVSQESVTERWFLELFTVTRQLGLRHPLPNGNGRLCELVLTAMLLDRGCAPFQFLDSKHIDYALDGFYSRWDAGDVILMGESDGESGRLEDVRALLQRQPGSVRGYIEGSRYSGGAAT